MSFYISERRIIYDYAEFGDSPTCIGEEKRLPNGTPARLQGFGLSQKGRNQEIIGKLLELELTILSNEQCYEEFKDLDTYFGDLFCF